MLDLRSRFWRNERLVSVTRRRLLSSADRLRPSLPPDATRVGRLKKRLRPRVAGSSNGCSKRRRERDLRGCERPEAPAIFFSSSGKAQDDPQERSPSCPFLFLSKKNPHCRRIGGSARRSPPSRRDQQRGENRPQRQALAPSLLSDRCSNRP